MKNINDKPEWNNCVHPNAEEDPGSWQSCPDCKRQCRCIITGIFAWVEYLVPVTADGDPDGPADEQVYVPEGTPLQRPYYCDGCKEEFEGWEAVLDHIRKGTAR